MQEQFELPVTYKGEELLLPAEFIKSTYSYSINVKLAEGFIVFEPDEERNFRAMAEYGKEFPNNVEKGLIKAIIVALETTFK